MIETFKRDVERGLGANPKFLSSKYFYDKKGDELFVKIMHLPEYYLTRSEFEIFKKKSDDLIDGFDLDNQIPFELIELGAGDGTKTKELLKELLKQDYDFTYKPIDISKHALEQLEGSLKESFPELKVEKQVGEYFEVLTDLKNSGKKKVILFLGSNIGNLTDEQSSRFLKELSEVMNDGDILLLGVDLIKKQEIVLPAYDDASGVTAAFNLNLLERINRELGANFNLDQFVHEAVYTEEEGIAKSYLKSMESQEVYIRALDRTFIFAKGERIHMEISRKYNDRILERIMEGTSLEVRDKIMDDRAYFADYILVFQDRA
ncbi:MAG: L-histidine N(alpha)-methyltransferase [Bacteroidetes bacterium]|nr:MAG: L-histidine N(alpha)-methyltransferase [Bacteroidota bacterium]